MPRLSSLGLYLVVQIFLIIASCFLLLLTIFVLWSLGFGNDPASVDAQKTVLELSIRVALLFLIGSSYLVVFLKRSVRAWVLEERWRLVLLVLFALGAITAMADPYHTIQAEGNWIRYWTAGALSIAGIVALVSAFGRARPVLDRMFGIGFGILFLAAGTDEILQFHERVGEYTTTILPSRLPIAAQDALTLGVAVLGVAVLGAAILFRHYSSWAADLFRQQRYQRPLYLFGFAVGCFMLAMVFDSFDTYLVDAFDYIRLKTAGPSVATRGGSWADISDLGRFANSLEEMLEFLSALGLLMMVGTLFSVRALQCGQSNSNSR